MKRASLGILTALLLFLLADPLSKGVFAQQSQDEVSQVTAGCIFCDDFNDNDFITPSGPWIQNSGAWSAATGNAVSVTTSKADLLSPVFSCTTCTFDANMSVQAGGRVSLFGWYKDANHYVEIRLMQDMQKLSIKQISGASLINDSTPFTIDADTPYDVQVSFDGTKFHVSVGGTPVPEITLKAIASPAGQALFRVKSPAGTSISGTLFDISVTPVEQGLGGKCVANRDCASLLYCSPAGFCSPAGTGVEDSLCVSGADCNKDLVCQLYGLGGTCVAAGSGELGTACSAATDCIAGLACNGTCQRTVDAYPPFPGVTCAADSSSFKVFFHVPRPGKTLPDFFRLPFPNDARVNIDGTLNLDDFPRPGPSPLFGVDIVDLYADALSEDFDGFSSVSNVTFRFSNEINFTTLATSLHFIDITDPADAATFGDERFLSYSYSSGRSKYNCQHILAVTPDPSDPLLPGRKYAVYLSSALRSSVGKKATLDSDLALVLANTQPSNTTLARVWTMYANFRAYLAQQSLTAANVAGVTVFTVQDPTARMIALSEAVQNLPAPTLSNLTLCDGVNTSPCAISGDTDRVCGAPNADYYEIHGKISIPNYQQGTLPYEFPADGGEILYDGAGTPTQNGSTDVCFALTVPKTTMPVSGWPLVVHAHGTGGSFKAAINDGISDALATAGTPMATLTFEGIGSGARRGASTRNPDGLVFNVVNPRAARDNHLQGGVDVIQALRIAQVAPFVVDTVNVDFDSSKTYFFGHSQGSNVGIPGVAVSNVAKGAVFSGAGSYLSEGILSRTSPVNAGETLAFLFGETLYTEHPIMTIWQTFFDRIDPVNFDPLILVRPPAGVASKNVLLTWGQGDTYSPESTLNITGLAMHLQLADPVITAINGMQTVNRPVSANVTGGDSQNRTAVCTQYQSDGSYDGHFVALKNASAVADWISFFTSSAGAGTPTIP